MAINLLSIQSLKNELGISKWTWVPLLRNDILNTEDAIPYSKFLPDLLPNNVSQYGAESSHCALVAPWGGFLDPWREFTAGGGATGTLLGALNGLDLVFNSFGQKDSAFYGLGYEYTGPELGYCVGSLFKEKVYIRGLAQNVLNFTFVGEALEDLIWR